MLHVTQRIILCTYTTAITFTMARYGISVVVILWKTWPRSERIVLYFVPKNSIWQSYLDLGIQAIILSIQIIITYWQHCSSIASDFIHGSAMGWTLSASTIILAVAAYFPMTFRSCIMTSSNWKIIHITGSLCGEFPTQRPVTRSLHLNWFAPEQTVE